MNFVFFVAAVRRMPDSCYARVEFMTGCIFSRLQGAILAAFVAIGVSGTVIGPVSSVASEANGEPSSGTFSGGLLVLGSPDLRVGSEVRLRAPGLPGMSSAEYAWVFDARPEGSAAEIAADGDAGSFVPDRRGIYTIRAAVAGPDGSAVIAPVSVEIAAAQSDGPPEIGALSDVVVRPGEKVAFTVEGSAPGDRPVSFAVAGKPRSAAFDGGTGVFSYTGREEDAGAFALVFTVTDGRRTASTGMNLTVEPWPENTPTRLSGRVLDGEAFVQGVELAVPGAVVRTGDAQAVTGNDGSFLFDEAAFTGEVVVAVDGRPAGPDGSGRLYGDTRRRIEVHARAPNALAEPLVLYRIVDPAVPPPVAVDPSPDAPACGVVRAVSTDGADVALPGLALSLPDPLPAGEQALIWAFDGPARPLRRLAPGTVGPDGLGVSARSGSVPSGTDLVVTPVPVEGLASSLQPGDRQAPSALRDGNLRTSFSLPSWSSVGVGRTPGFVWNASAARPRPVIVADIGFSGAAIPGELDAILFVGGQRVAGDVRIAVPEGTEPGSRLSVSVTFDAGAFAPGSYEYQLRLVPADGCGVAAVAEGTVGVVGRVDGGFGNGWNLAGVQRLRFGADGTVSIEEPGGGMTRFTPGHEPGLAAPQLFDIADPERMAIGDVDGDGLPDIVAVEGKTGNLVVFRNGGGTFSLLERIDAGKPGRKMGGINEYAPDTNDVAIVDLDGDGLADFVTSHQHDQLARVHFRETDGSLRRLDFPFAHAATAIGVGDVNGDGHPDIAVGMGDGGLNVVLGPVSAAAEIVNVPSGTDQYDLAVSDVDGDGFDDVAVVAAGTNSLHIVYGGSGFAAGPEIVSIDKVTVPSRLQQLVSVGDVDGDGSPEIAVAGLSRLSVYSAQRPGSRDWRLVTRRELEEGRPQSVAVRDVFGDGQGRVFAVGGGPVLTVLDDAAVFGEGAHQVLALAGNAEDALDAADLDGDGVVDFVFFYTSGVEGVPDRLAVHRGEGTPLAAFAAPAGEFSGLLREEDGTFSRRYKEGDTVRFDADGRQIATVDRTGNTTSYTYEGDRLVGVSDPAGLALRFVYENGRLARVVYSDGRVASFVHDEAGDLVRVDLPGLVLPQSVTKPDGTVVTLSPGGDDGYVYGWTAQALGGASIGFSYDVEGLLTGSVDERGGTTRFEYDTAGRLAGGTYPDGSSVGIVPAAAAGSSAFEAGAPGTATAVPAGSREARTVDAQGNVSAHRINGLGAVERTVDPIGRVTSLERDARNLVRRIVAPSDVVAGGLITDLDYDVRGNIVSRREAVGTALERVTSVEFDPVHSQIVRRVDPSERVWKFERDGAGNVTREVFPDGRSRRFTRDDRGLVLTEEDERGYITSHEYDAAGRVVRSVDALGFATRFIRDDAGNVEVLVRGEGTAEESVAVFFHDGWGREIAAVDGEGNDVQTGYDRAGNTVWVQDATGVVTTREFDVGGRLAALNDPASGRVSASFDGNGNVVSLTGSDGSVSTFTYDPVNRLTGISGPEGYTAGVAYDVRDNLTGLTDGRGGMTVYTVDALDRVVSRENPSGNVSGYEYDADDLLMALVKPDGMRIGFGYDRRGRLTSAGVDDDEASLRTFGRDAAGDITSARTGRVNVAFSRNRLGAVTRETYSGSLMPNWYHISDLDPLGRRSSLRYSGGGATDYAWDRADRLTGMVLPSGSWVEFTHDGAGRIVGRAFGNGLSDTVAFDVPATGLLASIAHGSGGTSSYAHDVRGDIVGIVKSGLSPRVRNSLYDTLGRLRQVTDAAGSPVEDYLLDAEGNRVTSHLSDLHVTDAANRLVEDEHRVFAFDANGNLVRRTDKASGVTWRYGYSVYDELVEAGRFPDADPAAQPDLVVSYEYDALGRRVREERRDGAGGDPSVRAFLHDGDHVAVEAEVVDGDFRNARRYVHAEGVDDLVAIVPSRGSGGNQPGTASLFVHGDHQGSVVAVTDDAGSVVNRYAYDSYGNILESVEGVAQPYRFTGREYDGEAGLYHYRGRSYDALTGRFLQEDPAGFGGGDLNLYRYVWNSPANFVDPFGLSASDYGTSLSTAARTAGPVARVGNRLNCLFAGIGGVLGAVNDIAGQGLTIDSLGLYSVEAGGWALECGARAAPRATPRPAPEKSCRLLGTEALVGGLLDRSGAFLGRNSFVSGTPVLTPSGLRPIEEIRVGDPVAAIDEATGAAVSRRVTAVFSRAAGEVVTLTLASDDGREAVVRTTAGHPFHVEGWRGAANDNGGPFPSAGATPFGEWVRAGALGAGDRLSTLHSAWVRDRVLLKVANDDGPPGGGHGVEVAGAETRKGSFRVYNLEVESGGAQITSNYVVGDFWTWVHNARKWPPADRRFWDSLSVWKKGTDYRTDGNRIYQPDRLHGDLECYSAKGRYHHLGSVDPGTGILIKGPVSGRRMKD